MLTHGQSGPHGSSTCAQVTPQEGHGPEHGLSELSRVDADGAVQPVGNGIAPRSTPDDIGKAWKIGKANRQLDRYNRLLTRAERQAERKSSRRCA